MFLSGIEYESIIDGAGIRNVLFISGCCHKCKGCHNPKTWDFNFGIEFTIEKQMQFIQKCKEDPLLDGITLSGGDPMYSAKELISFVRLYKENLPNHNIWIYSGFVYEEIIKDKYMKELLSECDVLVDGPYIEELRDLSLKFRGSSNQKIINLHNCN